MKFRKKPVVIEAWKFYGSLEEKVQLEKLGVPTVDAGSYQGELTYWRIGTLEGPHEVSPGDYIIRGIQGEFYPCKPDIFEATYEKVEE